MISPDKFAIATFFAAILLHPAPSQAQSSEMMLSLCRKVADDAGRLKCYDAIGKPADPIKTNPPSVQQEWMINESKSPIDDSLQISAGILSEDGKSSMILRCVEHKTEALVMPNGLFAFQKGEVIQRINDAPAVKAIWTASSNNEALFAPNGIGFIKALPDDGTLFIRATGHSRKADDATFKLGQVSEIRNRISSICGWQDGRQEKPATGPRMVPAPARQP